MTLRATNLPSFLVDSSDHGYEFFHTEDDLNAYVSEAMRYASGEDSRDLEIKCYQIFEWYPEDVEEAKDLEFEGLDLRKWVIAKFLQFGDNFRTELFVYKRIRTFWCPY